jgi:hypothetical protein
MRQPPDLEDDPLAAWTALMLGVVDASGQLRKRSIGVRRDPDGTHRLHQPHRPDPRTLMTR